MPLPRVPYRASPPQTRLKFQTSPNGIVTLKWIEILDRIEKPCLGYLPCQYKSKIRKDTNEYLQISEFGEVHESIFVDSFYLVVHQVSRERKKSNGCISFQIK